MGMYLNKSTYPWFYEYISIDINEEKNKSREQERKWRHKKAVKQPRSPILVHRIYKVILQCNDIRG
jgi:hypothetical protein